MLGVIRVVVTSLSMNNDNADATIVNCVSTY